MKSIAKNIAKKILYTLYTPKLPESLIQLGYIFHTEQIYDQKLFAQLLGFCESYQKITGKNPICTLMTGVNPLVAEGMKSNGVSAQEYVFRARKLSEVSTLGYHGHFWSDTSKLQDPASQIKGRRSVEPALKTQFENDLQWFKSNELSHNGLYSGGWWFMNEQVQKLLIQYGFSVDFTFSKAPYFRNSYSLDLMKKNQIRIGEACRIESQLLCIQNFIGCHTTPFIGDFYRNMRKLLMQEGKLDSPIQGVVNSHDYDLDVENTLKCIEALKKDSSVEFCDAQDFQSLLGKKGKPIKSVSLSPDLGKHSKSAGPPRDHQTLE
jgi:hypothetical protein